MEGWIRKRQGKSIKSIHSTTDTSLIISDISHNITTDNDISMNISSDHDISAVNDFLVENQIQNTDEKPVFKDVRDILTAAGDSLEVT